MISSSYCSEVSEEMENGNYHLAVLIIAPLGVGTGAILLHYYESELIHNFSTILCDNYSKFGNDRVHHTRHRHGELVRPKEVPSMWTSCYT